MPIFEHRADLPVTPARLFEFLVNVRNLPRVMPPSPRFVIVDAPLRLHMGAKFSARVYKFGLPQTLLCEVIRFEEGVSFTDAMQRGPFPKFEHTHRVDPTAGGSCLTDRIDYELPGGLLGWYLTPARFTRDLIQVFAVRDQRFHEILS